MFWEPPAHRRGLAKRLQDQVSWVGPAVVVACERKDGAIKKVWLRYRHKLKGVPLEYVRLAAPEEQEVSETVKEALHDLEQQLNFGRVNAEEDPGQAGFDAPERPDIAPRVSPQYPPVEYSDEEMQPDDPKPVTEEELRKSTSVLDDVPFQLHRRAGETARSSAAPSQPSKRQKTTIEDPHRLPFAQKKEMYEKATRLTKNHLQSMKAKLEKHRQQASESDVSESISSQGVGDHPQQPPLTRPSRISETLELAHYPDVEDESHSGSAASSINSPPFIDPRALQEDEKELTKNIRWALLASMRVMTDYFDPAEGHPQLGAMHHVRSEVRRDRGLDLADPRFLDPGTQLRISAMPATPMTRATVSPDLSPLMPWAPHSFRRKWKAADQAAVVQIQSQDPPPRRDYWIYTPRANELARVHVWPRTMMFDPFVLERNDPIYKEVMEKQMPLNPDGSDPITEKWFTGVRSTQLIYLHNPITSYESGAFTP